MSTSKTTIDLLQDLLAGKISPAQMVASDVEVQRTGKKIILPEGMGYPEAIEWMRRKQQEEDAIVNIYHEIDGFLLDAAHAFQQSVEQTFGWTSVDATMISLKTGPRDQDVVEVPWGRIKVPALSGELKTSINWAKSPPQLVIAGQLKAKDRPKVMELVELTKKNIREHSVYRQKAVRMDFAYIANQSFDPMSAAPKFMSLDGVHKTDLVLENTTGRLLQTGLFGPIENADALRKNHIPIKRGVLLAGPYGTGKTMTASVTAKLATENGFTFIYCENVEHIAHAIRFAEQYAPAVLFAEDIDRIVTKERDDEVDAILNTIDSVDGKNREVITVLTTNHIEDIHAAMLRPGRLDVIVPMNPADEEGVASLAKIYGRGLLSDAFDFAVVGKRMKGQIPAIIREAVERAKTAAIVRLRSADIQGKVDSEDVLVAFEGMDTQVKLLTPPKPDLRSPNEKAAAVLADAFTRVMGPGAGNGEGMPNITSGNGELAPIANLDE